MAGPLLETKLHIPRPRPGVVHRHRLSEQLDRGALRRLILVSAPAGFGKTTALSEWLAQAPPDAPRAAWLGLDERDNDPTVFWSYVVAALQTVADGVGDTALSLLEAPGAPSEAVLATLINDLDTLSHDVLLVLDDFHLIEDRGVREGVAFLIEHLPAQVHLVIASRADPTLPLARMRARGELVELRAADLRFTAEESAAYLTAEVGMALTESDIAALNGRTEGWIAALQLAALSMQGRDDVTSFIEGFAGDDRYIVDYLAEEVLQRQPVDVRQFLLQTSILERLSGPLCDAVTCQGNGKGMLQRLERSNLFLRPLDDRRQWYRYHQLFADVLQAHLLDEEELNVPELHRRASEWFELQGEPEEAIRHAAAGGEFERAGDLAELVLPRVQRDRRESEIRSWATLLPPDVVRRRPSLNLGFVGAIMQTNEFEGVEARLRAIEAALGEPDTVVVDEDQFHKIPGMVELYRAALALARGDLTASINHARRATELAHEDDQMCRSAATAILGLVHWTQGDLDAAYDAYAEGMAGFLRIGWISDVVGGTITLADIRVEQGRLSDALHECERALKLVPEVERSTLRGVPDVYVAMSDVHYERNELDTARDLLQRVDSIGEQLGMPKTPFRRRVALARIRAAEGSVAEAIRLLDEAERVYKADFAPDVRPIPALRARVRLASREVGEASHWADEQGLSADDDPSYVRLFDHVTFALVLLAKHERDPDPRFLEEAKRLLARLLPAAGEGARTGRVIEILAVQALCLQASGDRAGALSALDRAVALAEPERHVRVFVDLGTPMVDLLRLRAKHGTPSSYLRRLLAAASTVEPELERRGAQPLVDPLSERELDVLRLLRSDLDGPAIARELVVSLNTVRTHTKNIYAKLGVNSRRAAVRRADKLDL